MATISDDEYNDITSYIRQERPRCLTKEERLDILRLHAELRYGNARNVSQTIARLLGRSIKIVKDVWSEYQRSNTVVAVAPASNQHEKPSRTPRTHEVTSLVRRFIRQRSLTRVRTVARDVLALLVEAGIMTCNPDDPTSVSTRLRVVQLYLSKLGFKRGKHRGHASYSISEAHAAARDLYVQHMTRLEPAAVVVYLDESYIHHHYSRQDSLYDPTCQAAPKAKDNGRRMCFIAGIMASGADEASLIALDIFEGGKEPKDYHGMFDHAYLVQWFQKGLDEVDALGKKNVPQGTARTHTVWDLAQGGPDVGVPALWS
ncbi:hypothetical protein DYB37_011998 [Aphanomyces astaci]|uniref:Tc1-like transposase DDE domain-containing protein n=1 Tax=Aphanomyces astaci TaxID=112090 RepID=A0A3R7BJM2_APHAT|nr:hypothetical protein DYB37_011998 [Aphanomyces astaci]